MGVTAIGINHPQTAQVNIEIIIYTVVPNPGIPVVLIDNFAAVRDSGRVQTSGHGVVQDQQEVRMFGHGVFPK